MPYPLTRMRRSRANDFARRLVRETRFQEAEDLLTVISRSLDYRPLETELKAEFEGAGAHIRELSWPRQYAVISYNIA